MRENDVNDANEPSFLSCTQKIRLNERKWQKWQKLTYMTLHFYHLPKFLGKWEQMIENDLNDSNDASWTNTETSDFSAKNRR